MGVSPGHPGSVGISPSMMDLKSPSVMSPGGGSIWEDVSVVGSPASSRMNEAVGSTDVNRRKGGGYGLAGTGTEIWNENGRILSSKNPFATPQGKGLGLLSMGTPGSLYDRDGFLKE